MPTIRVLLLGMTGILGDLVREVISRHHEVQVVAWLSCPGDVKSIARMAQVDLVITTYGLDQQELRRLDRALGASRALRVLAIEDDGRTASMYTLLPHVTPLGPLTADTLVDYIRASQVRPPGEE